MSGKPCRRGRSTMKAIAFPARRRRPVSPASFVPISWITWPKAASGFHPESFSVRRGRNGARQYAVRFDWSAKEMTLGPISAPRTVALPEGTYDVLSFIYQLSRAQLAPGRLQLNITTGNRLETYTLEVGREEDIEVPAGTIRAFPVRQLRRPGQESMEIWLAPERQLLPVRIRFFDRDGEMSGEQLAADIAFDGK